MIPRRPLWARLPIGKGIWDRKMQELKTRAKERRAGKPSPEVRTAWGKYETLRQQRADALSEQSRVSRERNKLELDLQRYMSDPNHADRIAGTKARIQALEAEHHRLEALKNSLLGQMHEALAEFRRVEGNRKKQ